MDGGYKSYHTVENRDCCARDSLVMPFLDAQDMDAASVQTDKSLIRYHKDHENFFVDSFNRLSFVYVFVSFQPQRTRRLIHNRRSLIHSFLCSPPNAP